MREDLTDCAREVDIMLRLDHPGVVSCYPTPPGLDPGTRELPTLTMEFCQEGDLRSQSSTAEISVLHSYWSRCNEARLSLVESFRVLKYVHGVWCCYAINRMP